MLSLLILLSVQTAQASAQVPSDDDIAKLALPEAQLKGMLAQTMFSLVSYQVAVYSIGVPRTCAIVRPRYFAAVLQYLPAWRTNLVKAYRDQVPSRELTDAVAQGPAGALRLAPYLPKIGAQMQKSSWPYLGEALEKMMTPLIPELKKSSVRTLDDPERKAAVTSAIADRTIFCGLLPFDLRR